MTGQKRTRTGEPKPQTVSRAPQSQSIATTSTPPCGQGQLPLTRTRSLISKAEELAKDVVIKKPRTKAAPRNNLDPHIHDSFKRPRLPANAIVSKRPLLHPAISTPFSSAESPKVVYITASSPFIPTCKRIRSLLVQIQKREAQSAASAPRGRGGGGRGRLEANGRLDPKDVEASISSSALSRKRSGRGKSAGTEKVFLKATGRAIPRALELGVKFQGEDDYRVEVEMGSVKAIDDLEVKENTEGGLEGYGEPNVLVPETRIRTLSTVTVCIGLE